LHNYHPRHCEEGALPDEAISNIVEDCFGLTPSQ
jgi:hypothetical protein